MSKFAALPVGVSEKTFERALDEFSKILGKNNVLYRREELAPYSKIMLPAEESRHYPSAVILAESVEDIQRILVICNKHKVPVWTISGGKNFGYGSAAPTDRGQVILDLRKMNKILEVNAELGYALVEPGVTYQQLSDYIEEHNLPLWLDCPSSSALATPLGNIVDRGVGYTPYGEHFLFSCGMEVVLADGEVLRTGMGAIPNSNTWQVFKWGYGPYLDGIFTQSNYGIVTKIGFWLMPAPPAYKPFLIRYQDEDAVAEIVDTLRPLRMNNIIPNAVVISNDLFEAATIVRRRDYYTGEDSIPDHIVKEIAKEQNLGAWNVYAALYGTSEQVDVNWQIVKAAVEKSGKGQILTAEEMGDDPIFRYRADHMRGAMNLQEFGLYNWRGGGGSLWFAPVAQALGRDTEKQTRLAKKILQKYGMDYVAEYIVGWRDMHHLVDILFDRDNPEESRRAYRCYEELHKAFHEAGYGSYRTNIAFMDQVADSFGPVARSVNRKIKAALDPNGILAPGKSGIRL